MPESRTPADRQQPLVVILGLALVAGALAGGGAYALSHHLTDGSSRGGVRDTVDRAAVPLALDADDAPDRNGTSLDDLGQNARERADATSDIDPNAPVSRRELEAALAVAEAERSQLAGTVLALSRRAESLETRVEAFAASATETGAEALAGGNGESPHSGAPGGMAFGEDDFGAGGLPTDDSSSQSLVAAGLDPSTAADILRRRDEFQLARLDLIDQAAREGWDDSERFGEQLEALESNRPKLRDELGDEAYDRYLHEEGSRNRVGIASVIAGSVADQAGLRAGDVVLSYAGGRLFRSNELQAATREGERGENIQLSVLRGGEVIAVDVARGPLGVTLTGVRRPPG